MTSRLAFRNSIGRQAHWLALLVAMCTWVAEARAQDAPNPPATQTPPEKPAANQSSTANPPPAKPDEPKTELSTKDTQTTFKLRVNLIQVRVVVRDGHGNTIGDLQKSDFQVFDQGKLQTISTFGVESAESRKKRAEEAAKTQSTATPDEPEKKEVNLPERFVGLVFDDIHLQIQDAITVRTAAKSMIEGMHPTERMAIFTTSGQVHQDFTSDKQLLEKELLQIQPRPMMGQINNVSNCPNVTHYMADQAINKSNPQILPVVAQEIIQCLYQGDIRQIAAAQAQAQGALYQALNAGDQDNEYTYRHLEDALRRIGGMPGERVLVLVSPGFILSTLTLDEMGIIDRANRAGILINTVDARGLYVPDLMGDIASPQLDSVLTTGYKATYRVEEQSENQYVLGDFAVATGGTFFHNSNDLAGGLKIAASTPENSYVLGFSPQNQKMDGRYHLLKVTLIRKQKYEIQARRGYYAPRKVEDPQEQAKQEIAEAVFSQDEIHELPLDFQTQYFKSAQEQAHLSVVSHIVVKDMHFRKADGRNLDDLTVATVIFDENGNYLAGNEKLLEMRLLDTTYDKLSRTGVTMKSSFDLKPGKYMVRQVIRDSEGAQMAARNGAVVIPY